MPTADASTMPVMAQMFDLSLINEGGLVMWPLLLVSLFGFVLFIERTLYLHQGQIRTNDFLSGLKNNLRKRRLVEALTVCEETPGPVSAIVKAALLHYDQGEDRMRAAVQAAAIVEIPRLEKRIGSLAALARIAPLLGLLGTVIGMLDAFTSLRAGTQYVGLEVFAHGMGEALITTVVGLGLAIMAHLAHHFLSGRLRAVVNDMEYAAHDMMQFLLRDLPEAGELEDEEGDGQARSVMTAGEVESASVTKTSANTTG